MILFLSPNQRTRWNPGHQYFRDAIADVADVQYIGPNIKGWTPVLRHVGNAIAECGKEPSCIMTYGLRYTLPFEGLGRTSIPKVHFVCDLLPPLTDAKYFGTAAGYREFLKRDRYDFFFVMTTRAGKHLESFGIAPERIGFLPHGVDESRYKLNSFQEDRHIDVATMFSFHDAVYPNRQRIQKLVEKLGKVAFTVHTKRVFRYDFVNVLNSAKIVINSVDVWKTLNMKFFEVMAAGALLLSDHSPDADLVGLVPGYDYIRYDSPADMIAKINHYLKHSAKREMIALQGQKKTLERHTNLVRAQQMLMQLKQWGVEV